MIDKNLDRLLGLADRHYVIEKGRVVWNGSSSELRADQTISRLYLEVGQAAESA